MRMQGGGGGGVYIELALNLYGTYASHTNINEVEPNHLLPEAGYNSVMINRSPPYSRNQLWV